MCVRKLNLMPFSYGKSPNACWLLTLTSSETPTLIGIRLFKAHEGFRLFKKLKWNSFSAVRGFTDVLACVIWGYVCLCGGFNLFVLYFRGGVLGGRRVAVVLQRKGSQDLSLNS
uniref:Uncharacterized protein n=1 Tax=Phasianus colchicus TaxID=9054 RepID=A0A669Q3K5_PHACC